MNNFRVFKILFYTGWLFLCISFFFKHTKTFQWFGLILLSFLTLYYLIKNRSLFIDKFKFPLVILSIFLFFLFWFVLVSPYKLASLEAFLLNYFFHISLFFLFLLITYNEDNLLKGTFWNLFALILILCVAHYFLIGLKECEYNINCVIFSPYLYLDKTLLKGLVVTIPPLVLGFFLYLGLFLNSENKKRRNLFYFSVVLLSFIFLLFLGRRAAILGIFFAFFIIMLITKDKILKRIAIAFNLIILLFLAIFITLPHEKDFYLKSRENLSLLFSFKYENFSKAGSMGQRLYIWPIYFKKSLEEPFSGTGLGRRVQKKVLAETNKKALSLEHAHLLFLNLALQAGWHTALIFLYFYLLTLKKAFKLWRLSQENPLFLSLFGFLIAYLIMSLFEGMEEGTRFTPFWIASGIIWGFVHKYEEKNEKSSLSS